MKTVDFIRDHIVANGGRLVRKRGDHHIYEFPNGRSMPVAVGGPKYKDAHPFLFARLRRTLEGK